MSDFTNDKAKALAMLYLKNQDLSLLTPEDLVDEYDKVYKQINTYNKKKNPVRVNTFN